MILIYFRATIRFQNARIYLAIQFMYLAQDPKQHHEVYFELVNNVVKTAPSTRPYLDRINNQILAGSFYKALKEAHPLVHYEQQLVSHSKTN